MDVGLLISIDFSVSYIRLYCVQGITCPLHSLTFLVHFFFKICNLPAFLSGRLINMLPGNKNKNHYLSFESGLKS